MKKIIAFLLILVAFNISAQNNSQRTEMLDIVFQRLEQNIANPKWLENGAYLEFKKEMYSEKVLNMEEEEFITYFHSRRFSLPFTHFNLIPIRKPADNNNSETSKEASILNWKPIDNQTAYLNIMSFNGGAAEMTRALEEIGHDKFSNLIIDLRNNTGGSLDAAVILGRFLTDQNIDAGVYLTRKWFEKEGRSANENDIATFPFLQEFTYTGIGKMFQNEAAFRMVIPGHNDPIYTGKVYVLINGSTGSTCEPLIDILKKKEIGVLVGEKSFGGMLSGQSFPVNDDYKVFVPIADFQTAEGNRIDKVGVEPNIKVESEKALEYVLKLIDQKS